MTDYHWNEHPSELFNLLEASASLTPLDGFDSNSFVPPSPITDLFPPLDSVQAAAAPAPILHDLHVPDIQPLPAPKFDHPSVSAQLLNDHVLAVSSPIDSGSIEGEQNSERDYSTAPQPNSPSEADNSVDNIPAASISSAASDITSGGGNSGLTAVEAAKKAAEDFANSKVTERKRKLNSSDPDGKRRKGNDGAQCSDDEDDAPEKVSHRKYQKRLQKNRDSAYVSRIRRREYTKQLEEGLNRVENEKNELQSRYDALQQKFESVVQELKSFRNGATAKFKALATPVGAARQTAAVSSVGKPKNAGVLATTMFMCAFIIGFIMPESMLPRSPFSVASSGMNRINFGVKEYSRFQMSFVGTGKRDGENKGRVWQKMGPLPPPNHWNLLTCPNTVDNLTNNITAVFGKDNGMDLLDILKNRVQMGGVPNEALEEMKEKAQIMADNLEMKQVKRTLPSRRSQLFKKVLRKLATLADECFTKEVIALLTIRMMPGEVRRMIETKNV